MNAEDFFNTLKSAVTERIASPFWWSLTISWCIWNYAFLMVLLSDNTVSITMHLIQQVAYPTAWHKAILGVIGPVISALIYVFVYPYAAKRMNDFTLERERERNESRQKIHGESLLSVEESNKLRVKIRTLKSDFNKQLKELDDENKALLEENLRLKSDFSKISTEKRDNFEEEEEEEILSDQQIKSELIEEVNDEGRMILQIIGNNAGSVRYANLKGLTQHGEVKLQWLMDQLSTKKLITQVATGEKGGTVKLTKLGRDFYIRHIL